MLDAVPIVTPNCDVVVPSLSLTVIIITIVIVLIIVINFEIVQQAYHPRTLFECL